MERVIKRYPNRKLYDLRESRYITLADLDALLLAESEGAETVVIIDSQSGDDITRRTLIQRMLQKESRDPGAILSVKSLKTMVTDGREVLRQAIHKTSEIGRRISIPGRPGRVGSDTEQDPGPGWIDFQSITKSVEQAGIWISHIVNERIKRNFLHLPSSSDWESLTSKLDRLEERVNHLVSGKEENEP